VGGARDSQLGPRMLQSGQALRNIVGKLTSSQRRPASSAEPANAAEATPLSADVVDAAATMMLVHPLPAPGLAVETAKPKPKPKPKSKRKRKPTVLPQVVTEAMMGTDVGSDNGCKLTIDMLRKICTSGMLGLSRKATDTGSRSTWKLVLDVIRKHSGTLKFSEPIYNAGRTTCSQSWLQPVPR